MTDRRVGRRTVLRAAARALAVAGVLAPATLAGSRPARALTLDEARSRGLVGEKQDGYIAPVGAGASAPEVMALIDQVNAARRQSYQNIATSNGTPLATVEALAGKHLIERASPGTFVEIQPGQFVRK